MWEWFSKLFTVPADMPVPPSLGEIEAMTRQTTSVVERVTAETLDGPYPNGSVPYGDGPESLALRAKRFACAAVNHHPRRYDGSWCFGYSYVCGRCRMYADPWSEQKTAAIVDSIGSNPDQMDIADACSDGEDSC